MNPGMYLLSHFTDKGENEPLNMETTYSNQETGSEGAGTKDRSFQPQNCMLATPLPAFFLATPPESS